MEDKEKKVPKKVIHNTFIFPDNDPYLEDIYRRLAEKHSLPKGQIERLCRFQFQFVAKVMEKGDKESVRLKYLGIFGIKYLREKFNRKKKGVEPKIKKEIDGEDNS